MTNIKHLTTCLILALCAGSAYAVPQLNCKGTYPGVYTRNAKHITVRLQKVNMSTLSLYSSVKPNTGGNRVFVYFDVDKNRAAGYCLFVYRDSWTLRKEGKPGLYNIEVAAGKTKKLKVNSAQGFSVTFNDSLIQGKINRCWNFHMRRYVNGRLTAS